ncbi:hypothetical protein [Kallipyga gabonensis]|uniref:hypothetical protein n=1 Tax=Kallipyga gabonensis TaxID=1686287 RepID=UPI0006B46039|nr:hypothetical protein [Kallipyga gabonensis]
MLTFVLGPSGSGKTNYLIQEANEEKRSGNGNIVFIDSDNAQIFSLDHDVRLVDAHEFGVDNLDLMEGFLAGIIASDYDIEKLYLDGLYDLIDFSDKLHDLIPRLRQLADKNNVQIYMGLALKKEDFPVDADLQFVELDD